MYGIGVHEDPSSERAPTERERQPRVSVCVQAIVVMIEKTAELR